MEDLSFMWNDIHILKGKTGKYLTQSNDKMPYNKAKWHQNVKYMYSDYGPTNDDQLELHVHTEKANHPMYNITDVIKPVYGIPTFGLKGGLHYMI